MPQDKIVIKGARENNLKNIDLELPRDKLIVVTGVSGSGKSTLAFDTIYAEGQRRYVESLSAYARQFLGGIDKPDVDSIDGLSPSIAIDQKSTHNNPRSTVGTVTEIYDYLRLLYARVGTPYCPHHHIPIQAQTIKQMMERLYQYPEGTKMQLLAPVASQAKGTHKDLLDQLLKSGFIRVRINKEYKLIEELGNFDKNKKWDIDVVIDRIVLTQDGRTRLSDSLELALQWGNGITYVVLEDEEVFSLRIWPSSLCFYHWEIRTKAISFNAPTGVCPHVMALSNQRS